MSLNAKTSLSRYVMVDGIFPSRILQNRQLSALMVRLRAKDTSVDDGAPAGDRGSERRALVGALGALSWVRWARKAAIASCAAMARSVSGSARRWYAPSKKRSRCRSYAAISSRRRWAAERWAGSVIAFMRRDSDGSTSTAGHWFREAMSRDRI